MFAYPRGQLFLGELSGCDELDYLGSINLLCSQFPAVHLQEDVNDGKRDTLITFGKTMITCKRIPVCSCEALKRRRGIGIAELMLRPAESRFQLSYPHGAGKAAVLGD